MRERPILWESPKIGLSCCRPLSLSHVISLNQSDLWNQQTDHMGDARESDLCNRVRSVWERPITPLSLQATVTPLPWNRWDWPRVREEVWLHRLDSLAHGLSHTDRTLLHRSDRSQLWSDLPGERGSEITWLCVREAVCERVRSVKSIANNYNQ